MDPRQTTPPPGPDPHGAPNGGWNGASYDWASEFRQGPGQPQWRPPMPDPSAVLALLDALRRMVPPELQEQFAALQREVLLTIRALIDWYLERLDARARPAEVEDIPID
jgi:hypothetical protein